MHQVLHSSLLRRHLWTNNWHITSLVKFKFVAMPFSANINKKDTQIIFIAKFPAFQTFKVRLAKNILLNGLFHKLCWEIIVMMTMKWWWWLWRLCMIMIMMMMTKELLGWWIDHFERWSWGSSCALYVGDKNILTLGVYTSVILLQQEHTDACPSCDYVLFNDIIVKTNSTLSPSTK